MLRRPMIRNTENANMQSKQNRSKNEDTTRRQMRCLWCKQKKQLSLFQRSMITSVKCAQKEWLPLCIADICSNESEHDFQFHLRRVQNHSVYTQIMKFLCAAYFDKGVTKHLTSVKMLKESIWRLFWCEKSLRPLASISSNQS